MNFLLRKFGMNTQEGMNAQEIIHDASILELPG